MSDSLNLYSQKCTQLLGESEIRFAGIVDKDGKLIAGGFKDGLIPHEGDETRLQSFLEFGIEFLKRLVCISSFHTVVYWLENK